MELPLKSTLFRFRVAIQPDRARAYIVESGVGGFQHAKGKQPDPVHPYIFQDQFAVDRGAEGRVVGAAAARNAVAIADNLDLGVFADMQKTSLALPAARLQSEVSVYLAEVLRLPRPGMPQASSAGLLISAAPLLPIVPLQAPV